MFPMGCVSPWKRPRHGHGDASSWELKRKREGGFMSDHSDHGWFREQVFVNLRRPVLISYDGGILTVIMINTAWEH